MSPASIADPCSGGADDELIVAEAGLSAVSRLDQQRRIGLRLVAQVQPQRRVLAALNVRSASAVRAEPSQDVRVGDGVKCPPNPWGFKNTTPSSSSALTDGGIAS